jgi:hypothetical protein
MTQHYYPMQPMQSYDPQQQLQQQHEMNLLMNAAKTGAMVGASGAAAYNLHRMRNEGITWQEAAMNTAKVGFTAGVATAAATAVGHMFSRHPALSLAATLATGTAVMYALTNGKKEASDE